MSKKKLKILACPANKGGCAYYRVIAPAEKLQELYGEQIEVRFDYNPLGMKEEEAKGGMSPVDMSSVWQPNWTFDNIKWADVIWTNNISNFGGPYTARLVGKAKEFGKFVHYDTDDLLTDLYPDHRLYEVYKDKGLEGITKFIYSNADLVTVTQRKFAERVKEYCGGVLAVVKNAIDYSLDAWNVPKVPAFKKGLTRVGWAGGIHHGVDVKEFAGVPHFVNQRAGRERVHWGFFGAPNPAESGKEEWQHEVWREYKREFLKGYKGKRNWDIFPALSPDSYGGIYAHFDLAIAPLQMNAFNDSKSEIKVAECGRYKVPLIASNVGCYDETIVNGKTGYLIDAAAPPADWVKILTKCVKNPRHVKEMGENLHKVTEEYFDLNKVCKHRLNLYEQALGLVLSRDGKENLTYNTEWSFDG
jgi:glycosyltransferase involved in cell wall biosynthesis